MSPRCRKMTPGAFGVGGEHGWLRPFRAMLGDC